MLYYKIILKINSKTIFKIFENFYKLNEKLVLKKKLISVNQSSKIAEYK